MSTLKGKHESAVIKKGVNWLAKLTGGPEASVVHGPCLEPPDGWVVFAGARVWVEVVQVFVDDYEATAVWEMARGKQNAGEFVAHDPDKMLVGRIAGAVASKCEKPAYLVLAKQHGVGLLFVQIESPLAFGDEFWNGLKQMLSSTSKSSLCNSFRALLVMSRVDDDALLFELAT